MLPKHILGHAAVVLGLVVSLSAPAVAQPKVFDGTYVAVGVSLFTQSASTSFTGLDEGTPFSASSKTTKTDVGGGVIVGYGKQLLARYYVGGELDFGVNNSSHQASSTFGSATTTYSRLTVSPMLRLGYLLRDDLMLFGRVGFALGNIRHSNSGIEAAEPFETYLSGKVRSERISPKVGIGFEHQFLSLRNQPNDLSMWFIRGDASYTFLGRGISAATNPALSDPDADFNMTTRQNSSGVTEFRLSMGVRM